MNKINYDKMLDVLVLLIKRVGKKKVKNFLVNFNVALNCGSFRKHPNKKARSATKYLVFLAILFCNSINNYKKTY